MAAAFELHLKAGVTLDHEADDQFDVTVQVDDATVGGTPDASQSRFRLSVTDENEAPTAVSLDEHKSPPSPRTRIPPVPPKSPTSLSPMMPWAQTT